MLLSEGRRVGWGVGSPVCCLELILSLVPVRQYDHLAVKEELAVLLFNGLWSEWAHHHGLFALCPW